MENQGNNDRHFKKDLSHITWDDVLRRQATRAPLMAAWFAALDLKPGRHVLDLGSGPGFVSLAMADIVGASGLVYAVDYSAEALAELERLQSERGITNIKRFAADAADISGLDMQPDCAAVTMVLHHTDNPQQILSSVAAVLPRGAPCVVAEFCPDGPCTLGPPQAARIARDQVAEWSAATGLDVVKTVRQTEEHYMMVLRRR